MEHESLPRQVARTATSWLGSVGRLASSGLSSAGRFFGYNQPTGLNHGRIAAVAATALALYGGYRLLRGNRRQRLQRETLPNGDIREIARRRALERARVSTDTLARLRRERPTLHSPQIGGGAAVSALGNDTLLVDDRGRWQRDANTAIAQRAQDMVELDQSGFMHRADLPRDADGLRTSVAAISALEDQRAAAGPVVNGRGTLRLREGQWRLGIQPTVGDALELPVDGIPVVATGFPPERVPVTRNGDHQADEAARWQLLHEAGRAFMGDEANLDTFNPAEHSHIVIAGTGGTSISTAELLLRRHPTVRVSMVGRSINAQLADGHQWQSVYAEFGPDGDNRLAIHAPGYGDHTAHQLGGVQTHDGQLGWGGHFGDYAVATMGRAATVPSPIAAAVADAPGQVTAQALWNGEDADRQYLGYRLSIPTSADLDAPMRHVDVTGAASRFPPTEGITWQADNGPAEIAEAGRQEEQAAGPGIFAGGFQRSLYQAYRYRLANG